MTWSVDAAAWVWWCNDLGSRCSGVGLIVGCCVFFFGGVDGLGFFFFGVDGRFWVGGGGGVRCV